MGPKAEFTRACACYLSYWARRCCFSVQVKRQQMVVLGVGLITWVVQERNMHGCLGTSKQVYLLTKVSNNNQPLPRET